MALTQADAIVIGACISIGPTAIGSFNAWRNRQQRKLLADIHSSIRDGLTQEITGVKKSVHSLTGQVAKLERDVRELQKEQASLAVAIGRRR